MGDASKLNPVAEKFVALFRALRKTDDVPERLELQGLATRGEGGELVLHEDVRGPVGDLEARLRASRTAGLSYREAAEANALDVDPDEVTHVIYALFPTDGGDDLYIGETSGTPSARFARHPGKCPELAAAFEKTGGKDGWKCAVLLVLPEDARSKELLLYVEARIQRLLDTVDGTHGLNCHYGSGFHGGAPDEDSWLSRYVELTEFVAEHGRMPSKYSKDDDAKKLGYWVINQRTLRDEMSTHRRKALEALGGAWGWRINEPRMTNTVLFEKLREDVRVKTSRGVDIPMDIVGARRVTNLRQRYKNGGMTESDRAIVDAEFPGLTMTALDANFLLNARAFAAAHPDSKTLPSRNNEKALYFWLWHVRTWIIDIEDPWRKKVLEDLGLSSLLETRKSPEFRDAYRAMRNDRNAKSNAEVSEARTEAREAKRCKMQACIAVGPLSKEMCT